MNFVTLTFYVLMLVRPDSSVMYVGQFSKEADCLETLAAGGAKARAYCMQMKTVAVKVE